VLEPFQGVAELVDHASDASRGDWSDASSSVARGVDLEVKLAQNVVILILVLGIGALLLARTREPADDRAP
jgi:hypothetical protein